MHPVVPFWLLTPYCDPFRIPPDRLHAVDAGVVKWLISCLVCLLRVLYRGQQQNAKIAEFDRRFQSIPKFPGLRVFANGVSNCAKYTAGEWVSMLKVLPAVVVGLFPPELHITEICVKLCEYYMVLRQQKLTEADIAGGIAKAVAFKELCVVGLQPVLRRLSDAGVVNTMKFHCLPHMLEYCSEMGTSDETCVQSAGMTPQ
jgi:hypothetical protein